MSRNWREITLVVGGMVLAGAATVAFLRALRALGWPDSFAPVLGLSLATPLLLYTSRSYLRIDSEAYFAARGRTGSALDAALVALGAALGGCTATSVVLQSGLPKPWPQSLGVGSAVLAANWMFIRRNRDHFEGNPWVGGKLGEWLDKRDG